MSTIDNEIIVTNNKRTMWLIANDIQKYKKHKTKTKNDIYIEMYKVNPQKYNGKTLKQRHFGKGKNALYDGMIVNLPYGLKGKKVSNGDSSVKDTISSSVATQEDKDVGDTGVDEECIVSVPTPPPSTDNENKCVPAPWMEVAKKEMNKHIQRYSKQGIRGNNPEIMKYHETTDIFNYDNRGENVSWCGTFINWVLIESGYLKRVKKITEIKIGKKKKKVYVGEFKTAFRALDWAKIWGKKYGKKVNKPIYGAIGVKSRKGGGHVSFVVGVDNVNNPKYVYMLGGNQWGKSNNINWGVKTTKYLKKQKRTVPYIKSVLFPSRYKLSDWSGFYVPKGYNVTRCKLKKYTGRYIISLSDGA